MEVTLSGIVILVRLLQYSNADLPMEVTLSGIVILVRLLHKENALSPMEVTLSGIDILARLRHQSNALFPMEVTESGITTSPPFPVYSTSTPFLIRKSLIFLYAPFLFAPSPSNRKTDECWRNNRVQNGSSSQSSAQFGSLSCRPSTPAPVRKPRFDHKSSG